MEVLREQYQNEAVPALMKKFGYKSIMQVPKLEKIVINIGLGDTKENPKALDNAVADLTAITGLFNVSLPRVRDFRGLPNNSFDGKGNYSLGIKEQVIFPEIEYEKIDKIRGMDIIFVTTANSDEEAKELLKLLGMPFRA